MRVSGHCDVRRLRARGCGRCGHLREPRRPCRARERVRHRARTGPPRRDDRGRTAARLELQVARKRRRPLPPCLPTRRCPTPRAIAMHERRSGKHCGETQARTQGTAAREPTASAAGCPDGRRPSRGSTTPECRSYATCRRGRCGGFAPCGLHLRGEGSLVRRPAAGGRTFERHLSVPVRLRGYALTTQSARARSGAGAIPSDGRIAARPLDPA